MQDCSSYKLQELEQKKIIPKKSQINPTNISTFCKMGGERESLKIYLEISTTFLFWRWRINILNMLNMYIYLYIMNK